MPFSARVVRSTVLLGEVDIERIGRWARITGNADARHLGVTAHGSRSRLIVNSTDPYDRRVILDSDTLLLEIRTPGNWSFTFE